MFSVLHMMYQCEIKCGSRNELKHQKSAIFSIFLHFFLIQSLFQKDIIPFDVNIDKNLYNLTNLDTQLEWFNSIPPNYSFTYFTRLYFLFNVIYLPYRTVTASCSTSMCEETLYKIDIDYFFHYLQLILIWSLSLKMK